MGGGDSIPDLLEATHLFNADKTSLCMHERLLRISTFPFHNRHIQRVEHLLLFKEETNKTKQNKTKQNKTKQNKTKQNKTKQNKTKQNKTTIPFDISSSLSLLFPSPPLLFPHPLSPHPFLLPSKQNKPTKTKTKNIKHKT